MFLVQEVDQVAENIEPSPSGVDNQLLCQLVARDAQSEAPGFAHSYLLLMQFAQGTQQLRSQGAILVLFDEEWHNLPSS